MGDSKSFLADFMPDIDSGTLNRWKSAIPQALNTFKSKINGIHPLEWVDKIMAQLEKSTDLDTIIEIIKQILGNQCFTLGVVVGMGKGLVSSVMELLALIKMFALAELEDLAHMKSDFAWDSQSMLKRFTTFPMMPNTLEIKIQLARLADKYFHDEMHEAAEQRDALLEELKQIITNPMKFLENLPDEFKKEFEKLVADLQRIGELKSQNTLSSNYDAGYITGKLLFEVISIILGIISVAGTAVKIASKFPRLMKLVQSVGGKIKPKVPGTTKTHISTPKPQGTGGATTNTSSSNPKPKPSSKPSSNAGSGSNTKPNNNSSKPASQSGGKKADPKPANKQKSADKKSNNGKDPPKKLTPEEKASQDLGKFEGKDRTEIQKQLRDQGYKTKQSGNSKIYYKDLGNGKTMAVRLDPADKKLAMNPDKSHFTGATTHAHKEIVPTADINNGSYFNKGYPQNKAVKLDDNGVPTTDRNNQHIPINTRRGK